MWKECNGTRNRFPSWSAWHVSDQLDSCDAGKVMPGEADEGAAR